MRLIDKFLNFFCDHAVVVNNNPDALQKDVEVVQQRYGPWVRVKGCVDFNQLFVELHLANANKRPISVAFIQEGDTEVEERVLHKTAPGIRTVKYSDTQRLATMLSMAR